MRNGNQPAREAALSDVTAMLKEPGFFVTSRCTCVCERIQPRDAACRDPCDCVAAAFAESQFCIDRAGWRSRSGRTTGRTFVGRSGVVSGEVYERESAASVYEREGRESNQQKPHFERDGVRAQAADQVLIRHAGWVRSRPAYLDGSLRSLRRLWVVAGLSLRTQTQR